MYGGDIVLTPEQQSMLEATSNKKDPFSPQNAVVRNEQLLWPDGVIYYTFDSSLSKPSGTGDNLVTHKNEESLYKHSFSLTFEPCCFLLSLGSM